MCDISGFLVYFISLFALFITMAFFGRLSLFSFIIFFIVGVVAAFRGEAGVDTPIYLLRFNGINSLSDISLIEPLIPLLMVATKIAGGSFAEFSIVYALYIALLYYYIFRRIPNAIYYGLAIFPVIFVDSLYNGLRIGLAYPLIFMAIAHSSFPILLAATTAHISAGIAIVFKVISPYRLAAFIIAVLSLVLYYGLTIDVLPYRYIYKITAYKSLSSSSSIAGLADTIALWFAISIYFRIKYPLGYRWIAISFFALLVSVLLYLVIIREYVLMIRIVRLLLVAMFALIAREKLKIDKFAIVACSIFGILYSANYLRQISRSCFYESGGFLPLDYDLF